MALTTNLLALFAVVGAVFSLPVLARTSPGERPRDQGLIGVGIVTGVVGGVLGTLVLVWSVMDAVLG